jgi:uncharacterized protein (DUF983 family)
MSCLQPAAHISDLSPFQTGLRGRCYVCGEGSVFSGFLKFAPRCEACGESYELEDAGDGPAIFVIFIAGFIIIPAALAFSMITNAPMWLTIVIWAPILIVFCIALMRPLRGLMLNMQLANKASEARLDDDEA